VREEDTGLKIKHKRVRFVHGNDRISAHIMPSDMGEVEKAKPAPPLKHQGACFVFARALSLSRSPTSYSLAEDSRIPPHLSIFDNLHVYGAPLDKLAGSRVGATSERSMAYG